MDAAGNVSAVCQRRALRVSRRYGVRENVCFPDRRPVRNRPTADKLIETRLLVHAKTGWVALPYIWDNQQNDATLQLVPDPVPVKWTDDSGRPYDFTYVIPNANECHECHDNQKVLLPIGPKARNLNKDYAYADGVENQLVRGLAWATCRVTCGRSGSESGEVE